MRSLVLCCLLLSSPAPAAAQETETEVDLIDDRWRRPLASRNQNPLALLFIYLTPDRASTDSPGRIELGMAFDYSNIIQEQSSETELVRFDLEYLRTLVSLKRAFRGNLELGFSVPFFVYYGGFLDPLVSSFHEGLGLPNHLRGQTPYGLVDYRYLRHGRVVFAGQESFGTIGDLAIEVKKELAERGPYTVALRGALKLPTGDPQSLSGSGATDAGIGLALDRIGERFGLYLNANYYFLGATDEIQTRDYWSLFVGADWRFKRKLAAILQFDYMKPPMLGDLRLLNDSGMQVALGLRYGYSDRFVYEWRLVEDLSSLSPDFTLAFEMGIRLSGGAR